MSHPPQITASPSDFIQPHKVEGPRGHCGRHLLNLTPPLLQYSKASLRACSVFGSFCRCRFSRTASPLHFNPVRETLRAPKRWILLQDSACVSKFRSVHVEWR